MSKSTDWLPNSREAILVMAKDWLNTASAAAWNIPQTALHDLERLTDAARTALDTAKNESTRTPVTTAQCKEAFSALDAFMRDFKRRYYLTPPLIDSDYIALGLKPKDTIHTPSGNPTAQVTVETYLVGRHELGVRIVYVTGNSSDSANKGYRIWYSLTAAGEDPPVNPDDLRKSFYTKRNKDVIEFDFGDSGKTAHFGVQIENGGKKGPWGPLVSALIP